MDSQVLKAALSYIFPERKNIHIQFITEVDVSKIKFKDKVTSVVVVFVCGSEKEKNRGHFVCFTRKVYEGTIYELTFFDTYNQNPDFYFKNLPFEVMSSPKLVRQDNDSSDCIYIVLFYLYLRGTLPPGFAERILQRQFSANETRIQAKKYFYECIDYFPVRPTRGIKYTSLPKKEVIAYIKQRNQNE